MSDTASGPIPIPDPTTQNFGQALEATIKAAPILKASPGIATTTAAGATDQQNAADLGQTVAGVVHHVAMTDASKRAATNDPPSFWSWAAWKGAAMAPLQGAAKIGKGVGGFVKGGVVGTPEFLAHPVAGLEASLGEVSSIANKPLATIQREYRYAEDVEATHGSLAAALVVLAGTLGATAGAFAGGGVGATLGAEAGVGLTGLLYKDSWDRAGSPTYKSPYTGQLASPGRDLASTVGLKPGSGFYKMVSGLSDGLFDLSVDPLATVGRGVGAARSADGMSGKLGQHFIGTAPTTAEDVQTIYSRYPSVRNAIGKIREMNSGEIAQQFPQLTQQYLRDEATPFLNALGAAKTDDAVLRVFEDAFRSQELLTTDRLPTMTYTRMPFSAARKVIENVDPQTRGPLGMASRMAQRLTRLPTTFNQKNLDFSGTEIDPADAVDPGTSAIGKIVAFSESRRVQEAVMDQYARASVGDRVKIFRNAVLNNIFALAHQPRILGLDEDEALNLLDGNVRQGLKESLDSLTGGAEPGRNGHYGFDNHGNDLSPTIDPDTGMRHAAAITSNQTGTLSMPTLNGTRIAAKQLSGAKAIFGRVDQQLYEKITQGLFKPLVLMTPSYAMHISLAELIPNALRAGHLNLIRSALSVNGALLEDKAAQHALYEDAMAEYREKIANLSPVDAAKVKVPPTVAPIDARKLHAIGGLVYRILGGTRGLQLDPAQVHFSARVIDTLGGDTVSTGIKAGEAYSNEVTSLVDRYSDILRKGRASAPMKYRETDDFGTFDKEHKKFNNVWQAELSEAARDEMGTPLAARAYLDNLPETVPARALNSGSPEQRATAAAIEAVKAHLDSLPESKLSNFERHTMFSSDNPPPNWTPHDDWARVLVAKMKGATIGGDGTVHRNLLENIANGSRTDVTDLDAIEDIHKPMQLKGRESVPDPGDGWVQRFANWGFTKTLNPMVNFLSREPIFHQEAWEQYQRLIPALNSGRLSEDEAMTVALSRATVRTIRFVHNLHDRTQWTVTMRNLAPFYFAQEQAWRRMGRLLADDPGAFRRYQLEISAIHDMGSQQTDGGGNNYFVIPGSGFLGAGVPTILNKLGMKGVLGSTPMGMGFSLSSTSVMYPFSNGVEAGIGPVAAIPVKALASLFPEIAPVASVVAGEATMNQPMWEQLVPNAFVQRAIIAGSAGGSFAGVTVPNNGFYSTEMATMQALDYQQTIAMNKWIAEGHAPTDPGHPSIVPLPTDGKFIQQDFINRVRNTTRIVYATRAVLGLLTPVSPEVEANNYDFPKELQNDITKAGSVAKGVQAFLEKNPNATPWTVFQSHSNSGPAPASSTEAEDWITENMALIRNNPDAAMYLMPQLKDTKYSPTVYNEQIAQNIRTKFSPTENPISDPNNSFLAQLYIAAANHQYFDVDLPAHQAAQAAGAGSAEQSNFSAYEKQMQAQNPIWAEWFTSNRRTIDAGQAINQLKNIFKNNEAPPSPMTNEVRSLMDDYTVYENSLVLGRDQGYVDGSKSATQANWHAYLTQLKGDKPELGAIINGVFMHT